MKITTSTRMLAEEPPGAADRQNELRSFVKDVQQMCPGTTAQRAYQSLGRAYRQSGRCGTRASLMEKVLRTVRGN